MSSTFPFTFTFACAHAHAWMYWYKGKAKPIAVIQRPGREPNLSYDQRTKPRDGMHTCICNGKERKNRKVERSRNVHRIATHEDGYTSFLRVHQYQCSQTAAGSAVVSSSPIASDFINFNFSLVVPTTPVAYFTPLVMRALW